MNRVPGVAVLLAVLIGACAPTDTAPISSPTTTVTEVPTTSTTSTSVVSNPAPGLLPDVPAAGCVATVGARGETEPRLSYVAGLLTVATAPGTSVSATFHMPNGDFEAHEVSNTSGNRIGYAFILFRLDRWTPPELIPHNFKIVVDVEVRQASTVHYCATAFFAGT